MEAERNITVTWRGRQLDVRVGENCTFEVLGKKLQESTGVEPYTMRLLVPVLGSKTSKLVTPFSVAHSCLKLREMDFAEGKPIRMMGAFNDEIEKVSQNSMNPDLRILGFDEEEKRLRQRSVDGPRASLKLPQGPYVFCDFRTLHLPGIKLTPPPSEALRRMHMLACDPGIVAIMNKHRWRVGVMTEMAPEGYVGVSPVCLLGLNKNQGEEISLRLRTDDLKGFRKYESIKRTLLHELAHMVHSEHDANFYALDKQLNHEAAALDWTKSTSQTLSGRKFSDHFEDDVHDLETNYSGQKLGGTWDFPDTARSSSVAAAYNRLFNRFTNDLDGSRVPTGGVDEAAEPDPDDGEVKDGLVHSLSKESDAAAEPDPDDGEMQQSLVEMLEPDPDDELANENHNMHIDVTPGRNHASPRSSVRNSNEEPDPDDCHNSERMFEPDPDDCLNSEPDPDASHAEEKAVSRDEPDPDDCHNSERMFEPDPDDCLDSEPDPDDSHAEEKAVSRDEPDPDDCHNSETMFEPDPDDCLDSEPDPDDSHAEKKAVSRDEPDPDDSTMKTFRPEDNRTSNSVDLNHQNTFEPDPDDFGNSVIVENESKSEDILLDDSMDESDNQEMQIIEEPVAAICSRLQKSIEMLRSEVPPAEATAALQTLFKIIRNAIDHPHEIKFKRLRKANPQFQRNVGNHKAAIELLTVVGFCEDVLSDEVGRAETYMVLKRNDPGLLWLAKSSLEFAIA